MSRSSGSADVCGEIWPSCGSLWLVDQWADSEPPREEFEEYFARPFNVSPGMLQFQTFTDQFAPLTLRVTVSERPVSQHGTVRVAFRTAARLINGEDQYGGLGTFAEWEIPRGVYHAQVMHAGSDQIGGTTVTLSFQRAAGDHEEELTIPDPIADALANPPRPFWLDD